MFGVSCRPCPKHAHKRDSRGRFFKGTAQNTLHETQLQDRDAPKPTQAFGLSGRIGQKRPLSSSTGPARPAGPARPTGHTGWTNEASAETIKGAHRASTRISHLCACAPVRQRELTSHAPGTRAPRAGHLTHPAWRLRFARGDALEARPYGVKQYCSCAPGPLRPPAAAPALRAFAPSHLRRLAPRAPRPARPAHPCHTPRVPLARRAPASRAPQAPR